MNQTTHGFLDELEDQDSEKGHLRATKEKEGKRTEESLDRINVEKDTIKKMTGNTKPGMEMTTMETIGTVRTMERKEQEKEKEKGNSKEKVSSKASRALAKENQRKESLENLRAQVAPKEKEKKVRALLRIPQATLQPHLPNLSIRPLQRSVRNRRTNGTSRSGQMTLGIKAHGKIQIRRTMA